MTAIDLAYEEAGSDEGDRVPLLLLHDLAGDRGLWRPLIPLLADHRRVIAADLRGHGESPAPPLNDGYDAGTLAEDCLQLLDGIDIERFAVAGSDLGGVIALELALAAPERVAAVVLSDATPAPGWPPADALVAGFIGGSHELLDRRDRSADVATLAAPQLWVAGALAPLREATTHASTLSPLGRLELVPRSGADCAWQRAELWAVAVNAFLDDATA
ncbi:MAG TPA: alpha/beta hydrolase [Dehalococcoidia bacterium]|nr:alpha/beta hydrolase [Dehalococcoidia bacterium]